MKEKLKDILITCGWSVILASIILQNLYTRISFGWLEYVSTFVVAVLAGLILVDAQKIVYSLLASILLSLLIMFFCLTLPATLGKVGQFAPLEAFYSGVIVMIFKGIFPTAIILSFLGAFVGGASGEKLGLRY